MNGPTWLICTTKPARLCLDDATRLFFALPSGDSRADALILSLLRRQAARPLGNIAVIDAAATGVNDAISLRSCGVSHDS